jgi:hypothetical protein
MREMMKKSIPEKGVSAIYPKFITNEPIGVDLFEGKSHERIADAIIEQIDTNCVKIIGLEGNWGSGKSNVIEIIKKKMEEKGLLFFLYNVWLHQEDLHRRIIPIELYQHLQSQEAFQSKQERTNIEKKLNELLGNSTETVITKRPRLSFGVLLVLLTMFLASFLPSLATSLLDKCKINMTGYILLVLMPLIIVILLFGLTFIIECCKKTDKNIGKKRSPLEALCVTYSKLITVYQDKETDSTYTTYTQEKNPSLEDFRSFIESISKTLDSKKLIIVFDDIDRIEPNKIFDFWGVLHNLFSEKNTII